MKINARISRAKMTYFAWKKSSDYGLNYCYKNPSSYKLSAELSIRANMLSESGEKYRIISHSCHKFTCGYIFYDKIGDEIFHYYTSDYDVRVPVSAITYDMKPSEILKEFPHLYN